MSDDVEVGKLIARIDEHDRRLDKINGSQERTAESLARMELLLQSVSDKVDARDKAAVDIATALTAAQDKRWSTSTRLSVVLGGFCALITLVLAFYLAFRHNTITNVHTTP